MTPPDIDASPNKLLELVAKGLAVDKDETWRGVISSTLFDLTTALPAAYGSMPAPHVDVLGAHERDGEWNTGSHSDVCKAPKIYYVIPGSKPLNNQIILNLVKEMQIANRKSPFLRYYVSNRIRKDDHPSRLVPTWCSTFVKQIQNQVSDTSNSVLGSKFCTPCMHQTTTTLTLQLFTFYRFSIEDNF
ncbi:transducin/WD40 repeat-like superfamily protein [Artemisia annua]|uniref:Transducin/WD40 repeat-like superfamily protein n=1 Tax=Artemisia annua TaxID=35608 RepID=A0A2U1PJZ0_ARTAN|nr:transducin/WD40 repeat-like superfamily protein [Artemisia annua]